MRKTLEEKGSICIRELIMNKRSLDWIKRAGKLGNRLMVNEKVVGSVDRIISVSSEMYGSGHLGANELELREMLVKKNGICEPGMPDMVHCLEVTVPGVTVRLDREGRLHGAGSRDIRQ